MEKFEKEVLDRYKLWQEIFEANSNTNNKDINEYCLLKNKDFSSSCSGCKGSCRGCGGCSS